MGDNSKEDAIVSMYWYLSATEMPFQLNLLFAWEKKKKWWDQLNQSKQVSVFDQYVVRTKQCVLGVKTRWRRGRNLQGIETLNQIVHYSGFIYLKGSMIEAADRSPIYWLSLDMDHLHAVIPMFNM